MERLVKVTPKRVHILSILDCYNKMLPLIYMEFNSEGITIQGSCNDRRILITTVIPKESFEHYECRKHLVVAMPFHIRKLGGSYSRINALEVDSWRVRVVFESNNGVSYELLGSYMYELLPQPKLDSPISFERYSTAKRCLEGINVEVSVKDGIASFRGEIVCISTFVIGERGEPYCTIPYNRLKL